MATLVKFGEQLINLDRVEEVRYNKKLNRLEFSFGPRMVIVQDVKSEMMELLAEHTSLHGDNLGMS